MLSDMALLERYSKTGDEEAFAELVRRNLGLVYWTCYRVTSSPQDAEDVTQECFVELARKAGTVRSSLPGWLHRVAKNRAINAIRDNVTRRNYELGAVGQNVNQPDPGWTETAPLVDEALERLPDKLREPLILHYFQELTQAEVAAQLGLNQSTVSRTIEKGIASLRSELKKVGGLEVTVGVLAALLAENAATAAPAGMAAAVGRTAFAGAGAGVGMWAGMLGKLAANTVAISSVIVVSSMMMLGIYAGIQTHAESPSVLESAAKSVSPSSLVRYDQFGFQVEVPSPFKETRSPNGPDGMTDVYVHDGAGLQVSVQKLPGGEVTAADTFLDTMLDQVKRTGGTVKSPRSSAASGFGVSFATASVVMEADKSMWWLSAQETAAGSRVRMVLGVAQLPRDPSRIVLLGVSSAESRGAEVESLGKAFITSFNVIGAKPNAAIALPVSTELQNGEIAIRGGGRITRRRLQEPCAGGRCRESIRAGQGAECFTQEEDCGVRQIAGWNRRRPADHGGWTERWSRQADKTQVREPGGSTGGGCGRKGIDSRVFAPPGFIASRDCVR